MLHVTDAAVSVLKTEVLHEGRPEADPGRAIRIRPAQLDDGRQRLALQPVMGPEPGDAQTQASDLDVFVAPELAGPLDESILDAEITAQGPELYLREQNDMS